MVDSVISLLRNRFSYYLKRGQAKNKILKRYVDKIDSSNSYGIGYEAGYNAALVELGHDTICILDDYLENKYIKAYGFDACYKIVDHTLAKVADYYVVSNNTYYSLDKGYYDNDSQTWVKMIISEEIMKENFDRSLIVLSELHLLINRLKNVQII